MYNRLFNAENPFWRAMGRLYDTTELGLLWLLCCLPVVTFGASTTAFYYAMLGLLRGEEGVLHQDFFRSFKRNFKQGTLMGLLLMPLGGFLAFDVYLARKAGPGIYAFFMVFFAVLFFFWACVTLYAFPLLAKFENSTKNILILAFSFAMKNFPKTLIMLAEAAIALWLCHLNIAFALVVFGIMCELQSALLADIFSPFLPNINASDEDEV